MRDKAVKASAKRITLSKLLEIAKNRNDVTFWGSKRYIKNCKVYDFYDRFITKREDSTFGIDVAQNWISSAIEVMLGYDDTKKLTMGELANGIAEAINKPNISSEDRWALYELCFLLITQMCISEKEILTFEEQTSRQGTPGEEEPLSLYRRVISDTRSRKKEVEVETKPECRMSLSQLLASVGEKDVLTEGITKGVPYMKADVFLMICMNEKLGLESEALEELHIIYHDFICKAEQYSGYKWYEKITLSDFAGRVTQEFLMTTTFNPISRREVMETYELCYEIINLMADKNSSGGHVTLMASELIDKCNTMQ